MPAHRKHGPDAETLRRLYIEEKRSLREVARLHGAVGENTARRWLTEAGIEIRPRGWSLVGGIHSPEHERKLRESRRGANSHWWKGGVSSEGARYRASAEWARIRQEVYERDNWTCDECKQRCLNTRDSKNYPKLKIQCHHIIPRRLGGTDDPENLVTLCMSCHHKRERSTDALIIQG